MRWFEIEECNPKIARLYNGLSESLAEDSDFWEVYNSLNRHEPVKGEGKVVG